MTQQNLKPFCVRPCVGGVTMLKETVPAHQDFIVSKGRDAHVLATSTHPPHLDQCPALLSLPQDSTGKMGREKGNLMGRMKTLLCNFPFFFFAPIWGWMAPLFGRYFDL